MYYFVTQKTGDEKCYYETHCARDWEHALKMCQMITRYYDSTCEIVVLNNGHLTYIPFTHLGDDQPEEKSNDLITESLQATTT